MATVANTKWGLIVRMTGDSAPAARAMGVSVDLVRFLSELGKVGAYGPNKARLVRRWQVIEPIQANIFLMQRSRAAAAVETY